LEDREWLEPWEATDPNGMRRFDVRGSIRNLRAAAKVQEVYPYLMFYRGRLAGQLNVSQLSTGALASGAIGYWVGQEFAGLGITPTAVALVVDYCFQSRGLHRMEICICTDNQPSLAVVRKLGFHYEGYRRNYIHINRRWRDHYAFSLTKEDVPNGLLQRWTSGETPLDWAKIPEHDLTLAQTRLGS
ncbi:MAG: GNAT family protein, partial [Microbacteriaceae bacterium]